MDAVGNVGAQGTNSNSFSNIEAAIAGGNMTVQSNQQGTATGVGDTGANANGLASMSQGGVQSPMSEFYIYNEGAIEKLYYSQGCNRAQVQGGPIFFLGFLM